MVQLPRSRTGSNEAGYTLVELLVVLSIIGLLIIAIPAVISNSRPGVKAHVAAQEMVDELRSARMRAVRERRNVQVTFNETKKSYVIEPGGRRLNLNPDTSLGFWSGEDTAGHDEKTLVFFPDGSSSGGRITVIGGKREYRVIAQALSGRVFIDE